MIHKNNIKIKIIIGCSVLLAVSILFFWLQHRSDTVVLGEIRSGDLSQLDFDLDEEYDENAPLVLNESGDLVPARTPRLTGVTFDTTYTCSGGDSFITQYDIGANAIVLIMSDNEKFVLPQSVTNVGARYAKWDDSVVFYEEAGEASIKINGDIVKESCSGSAI